MKNKLPKGWKITSLGDIAEIIGGGTPRTSEGSYWNGNIPWLSVTDFNNDNRWVAKTEKTITQIGLENSSTKLLNISDLIISARGTVGAFAQLKKQMAFNQSCYGLRTKEPSHNDFLFYLLKVNMPQFKKNVHGAVFDTITRDTFYHVKISLPPLPEQHTIAAVLSSLDDKIELLRRQNETLEKIAQEIFKEWFVKFNFPDENGKSYKDSGGKMVGSKLGEIPAGWNIGKLGDILELCYGKGLKTEDRSGHGFPVIGSSGIVGFHKNYLVEGNGIVVGRKGTMGSVLWIEESFYPIDTTFYVKDSLGVENLFFHYLLLKRQDFERLGSDSAVPGLNRDSACSINVTLPPKQLVDFFNDTISSIFIKNKNNNLQMKNVIKLRDALLPKLMSGEVRVKDLRIKA